MFGKRGQAQIQFVVLVLLGLIMGYVFIFNIALPILNTALQNNPVMNASNASQCLSNCAGSANLTGFPGASGIASTSYILVILAVIALAAGTVIVLFKGGGL